MRQIDNFNIEERFPAIITPDYKIYNEAEFLEALLQNKPTIKQILLKHGAILFRGFPVGCTEGFVNVINTLNFGKLMDDIRDESFTEGPQSREVQLHQEQSFIKNFPHHLYFYCELPPIDGGETTIADARKVLENLDHTVKQRFQKKNLTYNKKIIGNAVIHHPQTNEPVWFNQAHLFDFNTKLPRWLKRLTMKFSHHDNHFQDIKFSDNTSIANEDLHHIDSVITQNKTAFLWQRGDLLILDNILTMHGRTAFKGNRKILTAMTV